MKKKARSSITFTIRKSDNIGTGEADTDIYFQESCFIDTGAAEILTNPQDARCIVLGRTGVGKTALFQKIEASEEHVIILAPEALSLTHIYNSNLIRFFESIDTHLDLFYIFLWIHVISCECLKHRYKISNRKSWNNFLQRFLPIFNKEPGKKKGFEYLEKYGLTFWKETEERTQEFTEKMESHLHAGLGEELSALPLDAGIDLDLSKGKKTELLTRSKKVASDVQLNELTGMIKFLSEDAFEDSQNCFYVLIDGLDEDWTGEDNLRYRLIKALIEAIRKFQRVPGIKILVTMRTDLIRKVIDVTKTTGSQEEKYEALIYSLFWDQAGIEKLLDERVAKLVHEKSPNLILSARDLFTPKQIAKSTPLKYVLDRTSLRPREAILFINECLKHSAGKQQITVAALREAEKEYSRKRLRSVFDEWRSNFPNLEDYVGILKGKNRVFQINEITTEELDDYVLTAMEENRKHGPVYPLARHYMDGKSPKDRLVLKLLHCLYLAGIVGIKTEKYDSTRWSYSDTHPLELTHFKTDSSYYIHPVYWMALGINSR